MVTNPTIFLLLFLSDIDTGLGLVQVEGQGAILEEILAQDSSRARLEESTHLVLTWFRQVHP